MRSDRRRKELQTVLSLSGLDEVEAHVERNLGVGGRQLVTQENVGALTQ
jgi:hypothetical protein